MFHHFLTKDGNLIWDALEDICNVVFESFLYLMDSHTDLFEEQYHHVDKNFNDVNPLKKSEKIVLP